MKKYRLKEEVKKYFALDVNVDNIQTAEWWRISFDLSMEALEEVPQRVELAIDSMGGLYQKEKSFTDQEKDLCEKALNGELLDIDSLDVYYFEDWFHSINTKPYVETKNIITVLKQYLKENQR